MAKWLGEDSTVNKYTTQYNLGKAEYLSGYASKSTYCTGSNKSVSDAAGYSWARYLNLPAIFDSSTAMKACSTGFKYANTQSGISRLGKWHFYGYDHLGGMMIGCGRQDTAMTLHTWDYNQFYTTGAASCVFWQDLWGTNNSHYSYCTAPNVWRSYFQMTGTMLDRANNRLWVRPMIPSSMNKTIINAPIITPKGWGTLNYSDASVIIGTSTLKQSMTVTFDSLTTVNQVVLKNNVFPDSPIVAVWNNGTQTTAFAVTIDTSFGSAFERLIRVTFTSPIQVGPQGIKIQVFKGQITGIKNTVGVTIAPAVMSITSNRIASGKSIQYTTSKAGHVTMDLISPNGAKIGRIMSEDVSAGAHTFVWNGRASSGTSVSAGVVILRLSSETGTISKSVFIGK